MPVQTQIQVRRGTASSWTSTNPTLAAGEIGFETDTGKIKVGNGSSTWSALNYVGAANAIQYVYNASAGQTSFSGADSNGLTLSYTVGAEQVYVNGVLQVRGSDYTATNGTSVTLTTATIASDVVTIVAFGTFDIANTYTQAQANATFPLNTSSFFAGKNKIINGDFGIWQRGTSFSASGYTSDRWYLSRGNTTTVSQQTFTPGSAPVSGYEGTYFLRYARTAGSGDDYLLQRVEDIRTFAGQTVTLSFWAKADSATSISQVYFADNPGSGGSGAPGGVGNFSGVAITTSWARYTVTAAMPSIAGTTIGTSSFVEVVFKFAAAMGNRTVDIWGVQWEAGSVATAFETATGTIQGELAACQRYYYRLGGNQVYETFGNGMGFSSTLACINFKHPVSMRVAPSSIDYSTIANWDGTGIVAITSAAIGTNQSAKDYTVVNMTSASSLVQYRPYSAMTNNSLSGYIGFSAEL